MKRRLASLLAVVLLLTAAFSGHPVQAQEAIKLALVSLSHPALIKAGSTLTFTAQVQVDPKIGIGYGYVYLEGPSKQYLPVRLVKSGPSTITGSIALSPNMEAGNWKVYKARLWDADGKSTEVNERTPTFRHPITVLTAGKPKDVTPPELLSITVTEKVATGEAIVITATVKDDLSGLDYITAAVQPVAQRPLWRDTVYLFPTETPGEYRGTMLTDITTLPARRQEVVRVYMRDAAGNETSVSGDEMAKMADSQTVTAVEMRTVPEGLVTSPYLNLIHPGERPYWNWLDADYEYVKDLLKYAAEQPAAIRELIAAELPQLRTALDQLRDELYVDPATELKFSPYATTGKWMVLDRAVRARQEILVELERREQKTLPGRREFGQQQLMYIYSILGKDEAWVPLENTFNDLYGQVATAYVNFLGRSPEAVKVLKTPAIESINADPRNHLDRDVIYLEPIYSDRNPALIDGTASMRIPINASAAPATRMMQLFYEIGRHFGQAYLSAFDDPRREAKWAEYLALRGNQPWSTEAGGMARPQENLGDDFAYAYLPMDQGEQYYAAQAFPRLRENPSMEEAFRKLVEAKLSQAPAPVAITPGTLLSVGLSGTFTASLSPALAQTTVEAEGIHWSKFGPARKVISPTIKDGNAQYQAADAEMGRTSWYYLKAVASDGRSYERYFYYYRAPVLLDPLPGATNQSTLKLTGTAPARSRVTVGTKSTIAGADGRFTLPVALKEGNNLLRVQVSGSPLAALVTVWYEPDTTEVSLSLDIPGVTREPFLQAEIQTEPYAIVTVNGIKAQADEDGKTPFRIALEEGRNKIEVTAVNVAGNKATWTGVITRDTNAPGILIVGGPPMVTNLPVYTIRGAVDTDSTISLNGRLLETDKEGHFTVSVALTEGKPRSLEFVATDAAGNRTVGRWELTYINGAPTTTRDREVTLTGKVDKGVTLTYKGQPVPVSAGGLFSLTVPVQGGVNEYELAVFRDSKYIGFFEYRVENPLTVESPVVQEDGLIQITGRTLPGYVVTIGSELVPVNDDGTWKAVIRKSGASVKVTAAGDGGTVTEIVTLP